MRRDRHGVYHVRGKTRSDAFFGLGQCHARDRSLQLQLLRVLGQGRASENLDGSDSMLELDLYFRKMNFYRGLDQEIAKLSHEERETLSAYVDGINSCLAMPWELKLLGCRTGPWKLEDSLMLSRMIAFSALAQSQQDLERLIVQMIQAGVTNDHLESLFPGQLACLDCDLIRKVRLTERTIPQGIRWLQAIPLAKCSNNWAIAGRKTASGAAILANDPHLQVNVLPNVWYEVALEYGNRYCLAVTMPGLPCALIGRTPNLAWGLTYTFMDCIDHWVEECRDSSYLRYEGGQPTWKPFEIRRETVRRKGKEPETFEFYENDHGILEGTPSGHEFLLSSRWSGDQSTGARSFAVMLDMLNARTVEEGMGLLGQVESPWNWILADDGGNIGYQMSGNSPIRREGVSGLVPLPGWDRENDWRGFHAVEDLPRASNPDCGYLVTANQNLNSLGRCRPINACMGTSRLDRIVDSIRKVPFWDLEQVRKLQLDLFSHHAARYMNLLISLLPEGSEVLSDWDCCYDKLSKGAYVFERFYHELIREVFSRVIGDETVEYLLDETNTIPDFYDFFDRVLLEKTNIWYGAETRDEVFRRVVTRVLAEPVKTWGEVRSVMMEHMVLGGKLPRWLGFDRGPLVIEGGRGSVRQGQVYRARGKWTTAVPTIRFATDFKEHAVFTALAGGVSDRRFSRWYVSDLLRWQKGELKRLGVAWDDDSEGQGHHG